MSVKLLPVVSSLLFSLLGLRVSDKSFDSLTRAWFSARDKEKQLQSINALFIISPVHQTTAKCQWKTTRFKKQLKTCWVLISLQVWAKMDSASLESLTQPSL